jgi:hypothetical protein
VLSGVAIVNLEAKTADDWLADEVYLLPDRDGPLDYAITRWGIPQPPQNTDYLKQFPLDEWSPFAIGAVTREVSRPLAGNTAGIATLLDAREPSRGRDLTRKRSSVEYDHGVTRPEGAG